MLILIKSRNEGHKKKTSREQRDEQPQTGNNDKKIKTMRNVGGQRGQQQLNKMKSLRGTTECG